MPHPILPSTIGFFAVLLWGLSALWIRIITQSLGSLLAIIAFHSVASILTLAIWLSLGKGVIIKQAIRSRWFYIRLGLFCANVVGFFTAFSLVSRDRIPLVIFINYLWPTLTLIVSMYVVPIAVTRIIPFILGCLTVIVSIALELLHDPAQSYTLVYESEMQDVVSYCFAFLAAVAWGTYSAITRRWGEESGGPVVAPLFSGAAVLVALPLLGVIQQPEPHFDFTVAAWLLGGALANIIAFWCWDFGIRKGSIVVLSLLADALPWISLIGTHIVLGVPLHTTTIASAILLVIGALGTRYGTVPNNSSD